MKPMECRYSRCNSMERSYSWKWVVFGLAAGAFISVLAARHFIKRSQSSNLSLRKIVLSSKCDSLESISTTAHRIVDKGFPFIIRLAQARTKKPDRGVAKTNPFLYPFEPGIFLTSVGDYYLLLNKFPVVPQHVLLVTQQFQPQTDPLSTADFEAALKVMKELRALAFYNSGEASGHSQPHKHIQMIPLDNLGEVPLLTVLQQYSTYESFILPQFQFKHKIQRVHPNATPAELEAIYRSLLRELKASPVTSYNLLMTQDWMFVVLREKERAFEKASFNALAFAGLILVKDPEDLAILQSIGPLTALRDISIKL